jgi:alkylation response protein AidB-like acyl-CoA dehydrogenase
VRREGTMGLRGMPEGEIVFEDLAVPAATVLAPRSGFKRGFADLMNAYNSQRLGAGTVTMGIAAGALDLAVAWSKSREQFGPPIAEFQGLQWLLADMQTQLTASRLMLHAAACSRGGAGSPFPDPMLAAQAKIFASEATIRIVNEALQMFGARGYSRDLPLERMARDVRMSTIGGTHVDHPPLQQRRYSVAGRGVHGGVDRVARVTRGLDLEQPANLCSTGFRDPTRGMALLQPFCSEEPTRSS